jgi:hypothetical protein
VNQRSFRFTGQVKDAIPDMSFLEMLDATRTRSTGKRLPLLSNAIVGRYLRVVRVRAALSLSFAI